MGAATAIIAVAALACAALTAGDAAPTRPAPSPAAGSGSDLARCRALGEAGGQAPLCHAAWAEQRRRFFGGDTAGAIAITEAVR